MHVANTILGQLGGNRFVAMTGAKDLLGDESSLQFKLPRGAKHGVNAVRVTLDPSDTYTVTFYKIGRRGLDVQVLAERTFVYAHALADVFTAETGLYTRL